MTLEQIIRILDDSQHPGTTPAWLAIGIFMVLIVLAFIWKPILRSMRRKPKPTRYDAALHHHQKQHEGERW